MRKIKDYILGFLMFMIFVVGPPIFLNFIFSKSLFLGVVLVCIIAFLIFYDEFFRGGKGYGIGPDRDDPFS